MFCSHAMHRTLRWYAIPVVAAHVSFALLRAGTAGTAWSHMPAFKMRPPFYATATGERIDERIGET